MSKITPYQGDQLNLFEEFKPVPPKKLSSDWVSSSEVCRTLGFSTKHLTRLREEVLKEGKQWRNISPTAARPTYRYHLKRCEAVLEKSQANRPRSGPIEPVEE